MTNKEKIELLDEINNAVFPSREGDGVEHIDMSYKEFMKKLVKLADLPPKNTK